MRDKKFRRAAILIAAIPFLAALTFAADPWKPAQVIEAEALAKQLARPSGARPLILQVGFKTLYGEGHIPGAKYCGPANDEAGLQNLKECVTKTPRTREIVIYCGCCPWQQCPNVRPAFRALAAMGFRRVEVLNIPQNYGQDWVAKGFPTERGR